MKIYAPVKDFNGLRNNVRFVNGVGETDNQVLIAWFIERGYRVEDESHVFSIENIDIPTNYNTPDDSEFVEINKLQDGEPDFDAMTPNELREWMRENGYGSKIKNTRNKEKLLEILRGE